MSALDEAATRDYLRYRLKLAGGDPDIFEPAAVLAIHKVARGIHRLVDRIATDALTLAALDQRRHITEEDVYNASKSI
jgi:type II secretory pathway predicted ATPase ExeA